MRALQQQQQRARRAGPASSAACGAPFTPVASTSSGRLQQRDACWRAQQRRRGVAPRAAAPGGGGAPPDAAAAPAVQSSKPLAEMTIENLDDTFCDDFVCNSSPAVQQTVRSLARDITRFAFNTNFFQPDTAYSDGFRSFKGSDKYRAAMWPRAALKHPRASITKLAMVDSGTARIDWLLCGQLGAFNVAIPCCSTFELNQLTGRVTSHTESWDLSQLAPPVAAACLASRMLWSAQAAGKDAGDQLGKAAESLSSLASLDDEDEYYMNPTDPTRFFQKGDNTMNDAFMIATGVAALYLVYKVFESLETLH